jgi:hypothetical protein
MYGLNPKSGRPIQARSGLSKINTSDFSSLDYSSFNGHSSDHIKLIN